MELFRHKKKHYSKRERILKIFTWIIAIVGIALVCMLGALLPHRLLVLLSGGLLLLSILAALAVAALCYGENFLLLSLCFCFFLFCL